MTRSQILVRVFVLLAALAVAFASSSFFPTSAEAQQLGEGMQRTGTVDIENDTERHLFHSLLCTCGCPRESLGTCTCDFAHTRRAELRAQLKSGMSIEDIQADYVKRFGTESLSVPTSPAIWALPLTGAVIGAALLFMTIRKWRRRGAQNESKEEVPPEGKTARDDYDEKLDDELRRLDDDGR